MSRWRLYEGNPDWIAGEAPFKNGEEVISLDEHEALVAVERRRYEELRAAALHVTETWFAMHEGRTEQSEATGPNIHNLAEVLRRS